MASATVAAIVLILITSLAWQRAAAACEEGGSDTQGSTWPAWARTSWGDQLQGQRCVFLYSQAGYTTTGDKEIVVWRPESSLAWANGVTYEVVDHSSGKTIASGTLSRPFSFPWGGSAAVVDISRLSEPGEYTIKVVWPDLSVSNTPVIRVEAGLYGRLAQEAAIWFYPQRCGEAVPGWHDACHLDDGAYRVDAPEGYGQITKTKDATGGWHDAGDYNKWMPYGWIGIYALTEEWAVLRQRSYNFDEELPDPLAEASREVKLILKLIEPNGWLPVAVEGWHPDPAHQTNNPWGYWGPPETETDQTPSTGDERWISMQWTGTDTKRQEVMTAWTAAALAYFAKEVQPFDAALATDSAAGAKRILSLFASQQLTPSSIDTLGGLMVTKIRLAQWEGTDPNNDDVQRYAQAILKLKDLWGKPFTDVYHFPLLSIWSLLEYVDATPSSEEAKDILSSVRAFMGNVVRYSIVDGMGVLGSFSAGPLGDRSPLPVSPQGYNPYYAGMAYLLARLGASLPDTSLVSLGELQLQWILGRNPLGISMMVGEGTNPGVYHTRYVTLPGHSTGTIPGGIVNGILPASSGIPDGDRGTYSSYCPGDPVLAINGRIGNIGWWQTNEYWIPNNAWFILAATRLQLARDTNKAQDSHDASQFSAIDWFTRKWKEVEKGE